MVSVYFIYNLQLRFFFSITDTATCRCETLQKELDGLRLNHETELSRLLEQHVIEKNNAVQEKQKEYDIKLKEGENGSFSQILILRLC